MPDTPLTRYVQSFADMTQLYDFNERSAIHQFDGGASIHAAERMAYVEIFKMNVPEFL